MAPGEMPPGMGPGMPAGPGQPGAKEKPKRPEKVEDWKRDDYFSARADRDAKLVDALRHFAPSSVGKAEAAAMLGELIAVEDKPQPKPDTPAQPQPGLPPMEGPPGPAPGVEPGMYHQPGMGAPGKIQLDQQALEVAVWGIVMNATPESREIVLKVLSGQIDTGADRAATDTALKALAALPTPQNEAVLLAAVITPEKFRPPQPGEAKPPAIPGFGPMPGPGPGAMPGYGPATGEKVTAASLRQTAFELVKANASASLREKLAQHLVNPQTPLADVELLGAFLKEPHPANLGAQLLFFGAPDTREDTRQKLLEYFLKYSSDSMGMLLGVTAGQQVGQPGMMGPSYPSEMPGMPGLMPGAMPGPGYESGLGPGMGPGQPGGQPSAKPDPDLPYRIASQIWGPAFSGFVEAALAQLDSFERQPQVPLLASTVPTPSMRFKLHEALKARWNDGPAPLEKAGFPGQVVYDPATLVTLKLLPRAKTLKSGAATPGVYPGPGHPGVGATPRPAAGTPTMREKEQREQTEQEWLRVSSDVVNVLCQRFQQAGLREIEIARQERRRPDFTKALKDLPLELHEAQLTPKPSYRMVLPGEAGKKVSGAAVAPTLIHYVRLEHKEKLSKVVNHYKGLLRTRRVHETPQSVWIDACREGRSQELLRSIDVLITRAQSAQPGMGHVPQPGVPAPKRPGAEQEEDLVIQVLVIETRDPSQDPNQPPTPAKTPRDKT